MEMVGQLQEQLKVISKRAMGAPKIIVKIPKPDYFNRTRTKLQGFLIQMDIQFRIYIGQFLDNIAKIIFISIYLRGSTYKWFKPILQEYNYKKLEDQDNITKKIFLSYDFFQKWLEGTFGEVNKT